MTSFKWECRTIVISTTCDGDCGQWFGVTQCCTRCSVVLCDATLVTRSFVCGQPPTVSTFVLSVVCVSVRTTNTIYMLIRQQSTFIYKLWTSASASDEKKKNFSFRLDSFHLIFPFLSFRRRNFSSNFSYIASISHELDEHKNEILNEIKWLLQIPQCRRSATTFSFW